MLQEQQRTKYQERMEEIFRQLQKSSLVHQVLVRFSGGKDSSYLLFLLKEKYGLAPLAFSVIHPFLSRQAVANMKRITTKLKVEWQPFVVDKKLFRNYFAYGLNNYEKYNTKYAPENLFGCRLCSSVYSSLSYKRAAELAIPYVLDGTVFYQIGFPWLNEEGELRDSLAKDSYLFGAFSPLIEELYGAKYQGTIYDLNHKRMKYFPGIIAPFSILKYDPFAALEILAQHGLAQQQELSLEKTNCTVRHLFTYLSFKYYGCHPYAEQILRLAKTGIYKMTESNIMQYFQELQSMLDYLVANPKLGMPHLSKLYKKYPMLALRYQNSLDWLKDLKTIFRHAKYLKVDLSSNDARFAVK